MKRQATVRGEIVIVITYLTKDFHPELLKLSTEKMSNSIILNEQIDCTGTSQKTYECQISSTWKDAQHLLPQGFTIRVVMGPQKQNNDQLVKP